MKREKSTMIPRPIACPAMPLPEPRATSGMCISAE
jgi:hypothetical protein